MARTVKEYKDFLIDNFLDFLIREGWENLVDNMIDYEGIDYPLEEDKNTVFYKMEWAKADALYCAEEEKAVEALYQYLADVTEDAVTGGRIEVRFKP